MRVRRTHITEQQAIMRLVTVFNDHYCFPNVYMCGGEMDLAVVTKPARLLWEIEVKLSVDDWRADEKKQKWDRPDRRAKVARFYYAILPHMVERMPKFVSPDMGLIVFEDRGVITKHRPAQLLKPTTPLTDRDMCNLLDTTYYRYWQERWRRLRGF